MISGYYKYIVFEKIEESTGKVYDQPCHKIMKKEYELENSDWIATYNPDYPAFPDDHGIDENGCWFQHQFTESPLSSDQMASVNWQHNITMPVNMSDYIITSASLTAQFNATVDENIECPGDQADYHTTYDWARFYVLISNENNVTYEVAYYQMNDLGEGNTPGNTHTKGNTTMITIPEDSLIIFLTSVLSYDYQNFNVTLGIKVWCEDNRQTETDDWDYLLINKLNLTFTYEKKIDQLSSISWNQEGDNPSEVITNPFDINEAILNFKYKTNDSWPKTASPNAEIQVLINNIPHSETIKLWKATDIFQNASDNELDITRLIEEDKDINVSIQIYLSDQFELNRTIRFSIDDIYLNITYTETVDDIQTKTQLFLDGKDRTNDPVLKIPLGESLNITLKYTNLTGDYIPGALVQLTGKVSGTFDPDPLFEQHNFTVNTNDLGIGVSILTITAEKTLYETNQTQIFIEVTERETELLLYLNGNPTNPSDTFSAKVDETVNITVFFRDNATKQHLPNATVTLLNWDKLNETNDQYYNITISTNDLVKGINAFTLFAQLVNYTTNSINFFIEVFERETEYQLFLDGNDVTLDPFISLTIIETLNITVKFIDNETKNHIINATLEYVEIGGVLEGNLTEYEAFEFYSKEINATDLGIGVSIINIIAQKTLYQTQNIQFSVTISERETELILHINGDPKNDGDTIQAEIVDTINITIYYRDNITKEHIPNATVTLLNWDQLNETNNQYYNITIKAIDLEQGITILTIFAQKDNYQPQTIRFFIEVAERDTEILLFIDSDPKNDGDTIQAEIDDLINVTIFYRDNITKEHIPNATISLLNWDLLNETNNQYYNITIDATDLEQGITILTIFAQKDNYQPQTIRFFIEVIERETEILLFINGDQRDQGETIQVEIDDTINVSVVYRDNITLEYLLNATINLLGWDKLNESHNQYSILINANDLTQVITALTIFAQKDNYQPQTINIFIELVEKATIMQLFFNGIDKTLDPVFNITIGQNLNITLRYTEQAGAFIFGATILLIGGGKSWQLELDDTFQHYYVILDKEDIGLGVTLFSIIAQASNYESLIKYPRITVNRIAAEIKTVSGEAQIEAEVGDNVFLRVILNDTIFGEEITNVTVTFRWAYDTGELLDTDNDGIYETRLENVREGVHTITITAFAGDNYDFKSYIITLIVTTPTVRPGQDISWLIYVLGGGIAGLITIFALYQTHFKYPPLVRRIRALKKKIRKNKRVKPLIVQKRDKIVETRYKAPINELELKYKPITKLSETVQEKIPEKPSEEISEPKKESTLDKIDKIDKKGNVDKKE